MHSLSPPHPDPRGPASVWTVPWGSHEAWSAGSALLSAYGPPPQADSGTFQKVGTCTLRCVPASRGPGTRTGRRAPAVSLLLTALLGPLVGKHPLLNFDPQSVSDLVASDLYIPALGPEAPTRRGGQSSNEDVEEERTASGLGCEWEDRRGLFAPEVSWS